MPDTKQELQSVLVGKYSVRLYKETGLYSVIYSYDGTRMEVLEYDDEVAARGDFRLITSIIQNVLRCEGRIE